MMFLGLRKLGNICCGHKMFLNKIRNIVCVPDTKFVSATNFARAGKRGNICVGNNVSATMCPRLLGPLSMHIISVKLYGRGFPLVVPAITQLCDVIVFSACFPSTLKRRFGVFRFLRFEESFEKSSVFGGQFLQLSVA